MQPLYIEPARVVFEKNAAEVTLPEDANSWPNEIMQELYKQVPYIADFESEVIMDRVDAERGYGFGHVEVHNKTELQSGANPAAQEAVGVQSARIPVIIADRKLYPFDVLVTSDSKMLPLNEGRMRQALFRPQAFDVTSRTPGDMSMVGQLYPPYRQNYGFGGGGVGMSVGMGKEGSQKLAWGAGYADIHYPEGVPHLRITESASGNQKQKGMKSWFHEDVPEHLRHKIQLGWVNAVPGDPDQRGEYSADFSIPLAEARKHPSLARHIRDAEEYEEARKKWRAKNKFSSVSALEEFLSEKTAAPLVPNSTAPTNIGTKVKDLVPQFKVGSILSAILPTINAEDHAKFASALEDPRTQSSYIDARAFTAPSLSKLSQFKAANLQKIAGAIEARLRPNVVQVVKLAKGYRLKTASTLFWSPKETELDRGGVVRMLGEKLALAADVSGSVTVADGPSVSEEEGPETMPVIVSAFGLYRVKNEEGQELVGYVFPNLLDLDGTSLPVALFTNGSATAMQESIAGEAVGKDSGLVFGPAKGHGMFVRQHENGGVDAMVPMTIKGGYSEGGSNKMHVETYDGREVFVEVQPNIQEPTEVEGTCIVPEDFKWLPLGGDSVVLVEHPEDWGQAKEAARAYASVVLRAGGDNSFTLEGIPLAKFASDERSFLSLDDTLFLLAGLGTDLKYASEKIAQAIFERAPVQVRTGRGIKTASEARREATSVAMGKTAALANFPRPSLIKEAAFIQDPLAVDTVLSLGFINPENIMTFVAYLPQIDQSQSRLCELLIAARMGLSDVPKSPLEKSIKSIEEVIEGLRVLAFQKS